MDPSDIYEAPPKLCSLCYDDLVEYAVDLEPGTKADGMDVITLCAECRKLWESRQLNELIDKMVSYLWKTKRVRDVIRHQDERKQEILRETMTNGVERSLFTFVEHQRGEMRPA